ncbi:MAG: type II toxin-antitoxin system RelE/ParE family toxin [Xenococcaceae cyanobacterium MO_167.B52]|nr:type II toxin-antitoxin system RelE/ParE family toxin [Xenococcaceae cyanobacterium MO_167.B52]
MIRTFKYKETQKIFDRQRSRKLPSNIQQVALRKLRMLNRAETETIQDLRVPPANRLERLKGDREGQYSIRVNDQWRVWFDWKDGDALNVELVDYH